MRSLRRVWSCCNFNVTRITGGLQVWRRRLRGSLSGARMAIFIIAPLPLASCVSLRWEPLIEKRLIRTNLKIMNTKEFFNEISKSLFNNNLSINQKKGIEYKLRAFDRHNITDYRWMAYMLATSYYETARTMQPVEERGRGAGRPYGGKYKQDGTVYAEPNCIYFGRGDVQLTWYENYERMGRLLGVPLLEQPELALVRR